MGIYVNPGNEEFESITNDRYVDKTGIISVVNSRLNKRRERLMVVSRARRFGKSYAAQTLCAYYDCMCDSRSLFEDRRDYAGAPFEITKDPAFEEHINKYNVIYLDMASIKKKAADSFEKEDLISYMNRRISADVVETYPETLQKGEGLTDVIYEAVKITGKKFIVIIDEWDVVFREEKDRNIQHSYIEWLRMMFKDSGVTGRIIAGAFLTGILPIRKTGGQSAVSDFDEYTMLRPGPFEKYIGFTEDDVKGLCDKYGMDLSEMKLWYDGYRLKADVSIYNSNSVMLAIRNGECDNYWMSTSIYESLASFISSDFDGVRQAIIAMVAGEMVRVDTSGFKNDMYELENCDDLLTLLIHLGYLGYDKAGKSAYVPNEEVRHEYVMAFRNNRRTELSKLIRTSDLLLEYTKRGMAKEIAAQLEAVHETGVAPLFYNDEQSLRYVIRFAYISAIDEYERIEELPSGHGYADVVFLPKMGSTAPAMVVELKWNKRAEAAIAQIKARNYPKIIQNLSKEIILVGVNYDPKTKEHSCEICFYSMY